MLNALLYNTKTHSLQPLDCDSLLASMPEPQQVEAKQAQHKNEVVTKAPPRCHIDEFLWVDVTDPSEDDLHLIAERFRVHPLVIEDIKAREDRPKLHDYEEYLYIIFHALREVGKSKEEAIEEALAQRFGVELSEIDCLVGSDYVVTIHTNEVKPFATLRDRWQHHPEMMQPGVGYLLYELMDVVLDEYFPLLDSMDEHIDDFEDRLFTSFQGRLSSDIFALKRSLLQIRRVAAPTRDVVNTLMRHNAENGGQQFAYFQDLYDHTVRIVDMIDTFRDILSGALDAYLAVESNRMNSVMKTLTSASIILLIPTLIAGIYGMNFDNSPYNMPELHARYGYPSVLGVMVAITIGLFIYFRRKGWL